ncbi:MAG: zinc-ribbon domain-containing protein [Deltaproteobacteria bacterium]|jgi:predicted Zn finger-like uncharacterized protein|nr:zinc-ribbon domain-containing protein [Deltaproteobacteria bacterium]
MLIRCPECAFAREVDERKIPPRAALATCPKCSRRFRFRTLPDAESGAARPASEHAAEEADYLEQQPDPKSAGQAKPAPEPPGPNNAGQAESAPEPPDPNNTGQTESAPEPPGPNNTRQAEPAPEDIWAALEDLHEPREQPEPLPETPDKGPPESAQRRSGASPSRLLANTGSIPWEYRGGFCTPKGLFRTLLLVLTKTPEFFAGAPAKGSLIPAFVFALLMNIVQFAALIRAQLPLFEEMFLNKIEFSAGLVMEISVLFALAIIIVLLIFSWAINFIAKLAAPAAANFNITFKIVAYSTASLIFSLIPQAGFLMAELGSMLLCATGVRYAYKLKWNVALLVISPRLLILLAMNV